MRTRVRALDDCRATKIPEARRTHLMITTVDPMLVADLAGQVSGSVLGPQDAGYDAARAVHNGLIDRKPVLIVRCRTTNDLIAALARAPCGTRGLDPRRRPQRRRPGASRTAA